jgi:hypothetical protein
MLSSKSGCSVAERSMRGVASFIPAYIERVAKWRLNEMPEGVAQGPKAELDLPPQDAFWYLWFHETNHKTRRMP